LFDAKCQLNHLDQLKQSFEPIDNQSNDIDVNRTKLHRFIRISDDLEILDEQLRRINDDRLSILNAYDQIRCRNDLKLLVDHLHAMKHSVKLNLEHIELCLAKNQVE
jgi:hypothetical protein